MSSGHSASALSLVNNSMGGMCNYSDATSLVRQLTPDEQHEYDALREAYKYNFGYCRQTKDLIKWVDTRFADQYNLVGEEDMPKYMKIKKQTETMTAEVSLGYVNLQ
jgi:hypothetical protein